MLINQKYYDKTIASIKEAFYPLWASYQLVSGIFIMKRPFLFFLYLLHMQSVIIRLSSSKKREW